jgi:hypothetical protein
MIGDKVRTLRKWTPRPQVLCAQPLPLPVHGLAPRVVLGDKWWDAVRFAAYQSTNYHCVACYALRGSANCRLLHGHEVYEVDNLLGRVTYLETVPLCPWCHGFCHQGYLTVQRDEGVISRDEWEAVIKHGHAVLKKAGLEPYTDNRVSDVPWQDWRMVVDGKEYPPLHASLEQYRKHYSKG